MQDQEKHIEKPVIKDDEIDLIEVVRTIWAGRKLILKVTGIFLVIGLIIAFGSKVEYEANCKLMPENQEGAKSNLGGLRNLAGLAGINLNTNSTGSLTPELYPQIAQSAPFILSVWNKPIKFEKQDTTISSYSYFMKIDNPSFLSLVKKYTLGLPSLIRRKQSNSDEVRSIHQKESKIIRLNNYDSELLEIFRKRISVEIDSKSGIITLVTEMPDPVASAELAQLSIDLLTQYVTEYKISKARQNFDFVRARFEEAEEKFELAQENLALFNDRNRNVIAALAQTESQRLQNEYNLAFEIYKGLSTQLEQSKIKVKEETPVFTILEPVKVPNYKIKPRRKLIVVIAFFLGLVVGLVLVLFQSMFQSLNEKRHKWKHSLLSD